MWYFLLGYHHRLNDHHLRSHLWHQNHQDDQHHHLAGDEAKEVDAVFVVNILAKELHQGLLFLLLVLNHPVDDVENEDGDDGVGDDDVNLVVVPLPKNFISPPSSISQSRRGK